MNGEGVIDSDYPLQIRLVYRSTLITGIELHKLRLLEHTDRIGGLGSTGK